MADDRRIELDDLLVRPGTYLNPQTEVLVVVDDSPSIDGEIFNLEEFEGADWVLISDEVPDRRVAARRAARDLPGHLPRRRRPRCGAHAARRRPGRGRAGPRGGRLHRRGVGARRSRRVGFRAAMRPVYFLGVFIPVAIALELAHAGPVVVFGAAALGVIPCAAVMGEATEAIAARTGPGHRRPAERDVRQRAGADHRLLRADRGPPGGREGVDRRLDHRQHPARDGRGDAGRRAAARQADVQPHRGQRPVRDADAGAGRAHLPGDLPARSTAAGCRRSARTRSTSAPTSRSSRSAWRSCC